MYAYIFIRFIEGFHVVALHNRYARDGSLEAPPTVTKGRFTVYHPVDVASRGTWIGFNDSGLFAAVTDQHTGEAAKPYRSRGILLMDLLSSFKDSSKALSYLRNELGKGYRRGNFIIADPEKAYHILHDERLEVNRLNPGVHVFTNITVRSWVDLDAIHEDLLKFTNMRRSRALKPARDLKPWDVDELIKKLECIASDHGNKPGRGSICYHDGVGWYMSSSTIVAVAKNGGRSRILYCQGNPCRNQFIDYSRLIRETGIELLRKSQKLDGMKVALCLTGSVACIEAPKLARELRRHGAEVVCYMTKAAVDYGVSPHVMEWATGKSVVMKLTGMVEHLTPYDLVIVYPATLNTIVKIANGIADNAVTTLCAAVDPTKLMIAPAMNLKLYNNRALKEAMEKLKRLGVTFLEPRISEGTAKIASVETALDHVIRLLSASGLRDRGVLILAGPTRYDLDPVRYLSNKATGRLGYWLAKGAFHKGCRVKVIYGPGSVSFPIYIPVVNVYTVEDMLRETLRELNTGKYEIIIFSAAILDFKPSIYKEEEVKSGSRWIIELKPTPKVIEEVSRRYPNLAVVAFKLEYRVPKDTRIRL